MNKKRGSKCVANLTNPWIIIIRLHGSNFVGKKQGWQCRPKAKCIMVSSE